MAELNGQPGERYLSIARVLDKLSRKKSWLYRQLQNNPNFPKPVTLGARPVFLESDVDAYMRQAASTPYEPRNPFTRKDAP